MFMFFLSYQSKKNFENEIVHNIYMFNTISCYISFDDINMNNLKGAGRGVLGSWSRSSLGVTWSPWEAGRGSCLCRI